MIVCICHNISDSTVRSAIRQGHNSMHALANHLELGKSCGKCKSCAKELLREAAAAPANLHEEIHTLHFRPMPT